MNQEQIDRKKAYDKQWKQNPRYKAQERNKMREKRKNTEYKDKGKVYMREKRRNPEVKKKESEYMKDYSNRPKVKAHRKIYQKEWEQRPDVKIHREEYHKKLYWTPKYHKWFEDYRNRPEVKQRDRERYYRTTYGITWNQFKEILNSQKNKCKICNVDLVIGSHNKKNYVALDHNHATGKIRGILCDTCNKGLGHFKDNEEILLEAIKYLKNN